MQRKEESREKDVEERHGEEQRVLRAIKAGETLLEEIEEVLKKTQEAFHSSTRKSKAKKIVKVVEKARSYLMDARAFADKDDYISAIAAADYAFGLLEGMCRALAMLVNEAESCGKLKGYGELE